MTTVASRFSAEAVQPVQLQIEPALVGRNRLTTAFRIILAIPHLLLVGGPVAGAMSWAWSDSSGQHASWTADGGVLGVVAVVVAIIAWFAIVFTGQFPDGLWSLVAYYLRWRVRALAYVTLLRDEYPPFGDGDYPAALVLRKSATARDRLSVAFRLILAIPQLIVLWFVSVAWAVTTLIGWFCILFTGRYPAALYDFGVGALRWNVRVEAYMLLLHDQYPPFALD